MIFKYKRLASGIIRPIIPIGLISDKSYAQYEVLVDSGADRCVFDSQIAEAMGLKLETGKKELIQGITGKAEVCYILPITLEVGGHRLSIKAAFMRNISWQYGIAGQNGFFSQFIVSFDYRKAIIELKPKFEIN